MVRALLAEGTGEVRAVTRRPGSRAAAQLRRLGARVVAADLDDGRTLEPALAGAYGAFVVTDFWEHCSQEREVEQVAPCCPRPLTWWGTAAWQQGAGALRALPAASPAPLAQAHSHQALQMDRVPVLAKLELLPCTHVVTQLDALRLGAVEGGLMALQSLPRREPGLWLPAPHCTYSFGAKMCGSIRNPRAFPNGRSSP